MSLADSERESAARKKVGRFYETVDDTKYSSLLCKHALHWLIAMSSVHSKLLFFYCIQPFLKYFCLFYVVYKTIDFLNITTFMQMIARIVFCSYMLVFFQTFVVLF